MFRSSLPRLGSLKIKLSDRDGKIYLDFKVENLEARNLFLDLKSDLLRDLKREGLDIFSFQVGLSDKKNENQEGQNHKKASLSLKNIDLSDEWDMREEIQEEGYHQIA